jgi:hypothetical protein
MNSVNYLAKFFVYFCVLVAYLITLLVAVVREHPMTGQELNDNWKKCGKGFPK